MRKGNSLMMYAGCLCAAAALSTTTMADWSDDFEAYNDGDVLWHVGGWTGWDDIEAVAGVVSTNFARSGTNSMIVDGARHTDAIQIPDPPINGGHWVAGGWVYIQQADLTHNVYYIIESVYNHGGPYEWAIQMHFDYTDNMVTDDMADFYAERDGTRLPIVFDEWVEIVVDVDLDLDYVEVYYGGDLLSSGAWRVGSYMTLAIGALDLFTESTGTCYFDDVGWVELAPSLMLEMIGPCPGNITFLASGATPDGIVAFMYGFGTGMNIPVGYPCAGTWVDISNPRADYKTAKADGSGTAKITAKVPSAACDGVRVQALDIATCTTSNVVLP